jgi:multidrug efflux system outer membrane protein
MRRALFVALLLGGCTMEPPYATPDLPVPPSFPRGAAYPQASDATLPSYSYRDVFTDARLDAVIAQALANNQDVQLALANIAAARARYRVQRAQLLPQIDASASYRRSDSSNNSSVNSVGGERDEYSVGASVTGYEIDLFGRLRSLAKAERNRYFGSEAAARGVRLTLVADVADAWLAHAADSSLLAVAKQTAEAARESVRITDRRLQGGIAPRSDVRQAEIILRTAEADVAELTTAVAQDLNALELLVGAPVDPTNLSGSIEDASRGLAEVPAGISSEVLLRRPDVIEAEYSLRAANAEIGAARAALFPRITLTGLLGFASDALGSLFDRGSFSWEAGGDASYSIFSGGAGRAGLSLSKAGRDAALATYRKAVQSAFADVANTLARRGTIDAQLKAIASGREAAADNSRLATMRYRGGIESYLEELTSRQALYSAERSLVQTQLVRASNLVALYRSLGGDAFAGQKP